MLTERRMLAVVAALCAAVVGLAVATYEVPPRDLSYRNALQENRWLYFTNIRSIKYTRTEYGEGVSRFTPEDHTTDRGGFVIRVNRRTAEANIVWQRGTAAEGLIARPDSLGLWDPDTAQLATHWNMALRQVQRQRRPDRVLSDYFELVGIFSEHLKN
jgi:hypothetical protein